MVFINSRLDNSVAWITFCLPSVFCALWELCNVIGYQFRGGGPGSFSKSGKHGINYRIGIGTFDQKFQKRWFTNAGKARTDRRILFFCAKL